MPYMGPRSLDPACQPETTTWLYSCGCCCHEWATDERDPEECPVCHDRSAIRELGELTEAA